MRDLAPLLHIRNGCIHGESRRPLVSKLIGGLRQGDVVVFRYPLNHRQTFIKRVIGLPGDRIHIENKQVFRNGEPLTEPYVTHVASMDSRDAMRDNFPETVVPANSLFVLGDNRDNSLDSRYFGFVSRDDILARPWVIYWHGPARK